MRVCPFTGLGCGLLCPVPSLGWAVGRSGLLCPVPLGWPVGRSPGGCPLADVLWRMSSGVCALGDVPWRMSSGGCPLGGATWRMPPGGCPLGGVHWAGLWAGLGCCALPPLHWENNESNFLLKVLRPLFVFFLATTAWAPREKRKIEIIIFMSGFGPYLWGPSSLPSRRCPCRTPRFCESVQVVPPAAKIPLRPRRFLSGRDDSSPAANGCVGGGWMVRWLNRGACRFCGSCLGKAFAIHA